MSEWQVFKMRCQPPMEGGDAFSCLDRNRDNRLSWDEASVRNELVSQFQDMDSDHDGYLSRQEFDAGSAAFGPPTYQPAPPELVLMEGSQNWAKQMMKVINSDARLQEQAGHLDDLYRELAQVQGRYNKLETDAQPEKTEKHVLGPRVR